MKAVHPAHSFPFNSRIEIYYIEDVIYGCVDCGMCSYVILFIHRFQFPLRPASVSQSLSMCARCFLFFCFRRENGIIPGLFHRYKWMPRSTDIADPSPIGMISL